MSSPQNPPWLYTVLMSFVRMVLARRAWVLGLVGVVTMVCAVSLTQVTFATSLDGLFFGPEHKAFQKYKQRKHQFGTDEVLLIAVEHDRPFEPSHIRQLQGAHSALRALPEVSRVQSIANVQRVQSVSGSIKTTLFAEDVLADPSKEPQALKTLREDPIIKGLFLAPRAGHFLILVELKPNDARSAEDGPKVLEQIRGAMIEAGYSGDALHWAGFLATMSEIVHQSLFNILKLLPLVLLCLLAAVYLMFGRWWPVWVNTVSALLAVVWALGFGVFHNPVFSIMTTIVPCLILIISFSDVVHICSAYLLELQRGIPKREAIVEASADVGTACFLTSLTTCVGFMSMMFIPSPVFKRLGLTAGIGVIMAYMLAVTIVPICLDALPEPKEDWRANKVGVVQVWIDRSMEALAVWTRTYPRWILLGFAGFFGLCVFGVSQIHFETNLNARLDEDNPVRVDERFLRAHFTNAATMDVYVEANQPGGLLDPKVFEGMVAFEQALEAREDVTKVVALTDVMRVTHEAIVGTDGVDFVPTTRERLAQTLELIGMQGPEALSSMMDSSRRTARMTVYTDRSGIRGQFDQSQEILALARSHISPHAEVEVSGFGMLIGGWIDEVVNGQKRGVLASMGIIAFILILGFRSVRVGVVSMLPNILPLIAVGGYCGLFWEQVDSDTLIVAMIAIGIGVDDTIHFLARYRLERLRGNDRAEGLRQTFLFSGRGILMTTFIFAVGFLPLTMSAYLTIANMGLLLPYAFVVAVVADLLWVPALIEVGLLEMPGKTASGSKTS